MKSPKTKVMLSIGGPGFDDSIFSRLVNDEMERKKFVNNSLQGRTFETNSKCQNIFALNFNKNMSTKWVSLWILRFGTN